MTDFPVPEAKEGKRAFTAPYLQFNHIIPYSRLNWTEQRVWRSIVNNQPVAVLCRETIVENVSTIDWRIEPRDPTKRQELRTEIEYYEKLFEQNNGLDWVSQVEWILGDALDLPFGYGEELVYRGDDPNKRLMDFIPLDGATLMPTYNREFPVVQYAPMVDVTKVVVFPDYAINRLYYSPRREIEWRGWGSPPPEKIYLALSMLVQGDQYYWKLLVDTPEAGILDLIDMDRESAEEWLESLRALMAGQDPLKVPVLYEHEKEAKFIPFGRPPSDIMYDETTRKYAAITAAGYGLSLSDIGFGGTSNGGNTLAGTIREERGAKRKGIGFAKLKLRLMMNRRLPKFLRFIWVDPDEEQQVARGRAKLSSATAYASLISMRIISPKEARQDYIASGLPTTALPEDMPEEDKKLFDELNPQANAPKRENMLTATQPPSSGGQGEVRASMLDEYVQDKITSYLNVVFHPETLSLSDNEYEDYLTEYGSPFDAELADRLSEMYTEAYEEARKSKSLFSRERYRKLDEATLRGQIERALGDAATNIASTALMVKLDALDISDEVLDNLNYYSEQFAAELLNQLERTVRI